MADETMYFAVKTIGLSINGGRKPQTLLDAARHNLREIQAELGADGHIDPLRIQQNVVMQGPSTAADVINLATELYAGAGVEPANLRKDYCQAIELLFSLPVGSVIEAPTFFEKCMLWADKAYGLPVLLATAHHDEAAKHLHVLLLPLKEGAHVGSRPVAIAATREKRESFFLEVAGPAGLKRSNAKMRGAVKAWGVQAVLAKVHAMGWQACESVLRPVLQAAIERDPMPTMRALQIDVSSIRPQATLNEKTKPANAIGFAGSVEKPIGFASRLVPDQNLSGVGFSDQKALRLQHSPVHDLAHCSPGHSSNPLRTPVDASPSPLKGAEDEDGIIRDRDGFCQTPDAWLE